MEVATNPPPNSQVSHPLASYKQRCPKHPRYTIVCGFLSEFSPGLLVGRSLSLSLSLYISISLSLSTYAKRLYHFHHDCLALDNEALVECTSVCVDYIGGIVRSIHGARRIYPRGWEDLPSCGDRTHHHVH
jgi:hypothetical protein